MKMAQIFNCGSPNFSNDLIVLLKDECSHSANIFHSLHQLPFLIFNLNMCFSLQAYVRVKRILDKLGPSELFCDPDFPANESVLFYSDHSDPPDIKWARPKVTWLEIMS